MSKLYNLTKRTEEFRKKYAAAKRLPDEAARIALDRLLKEYGSAWVQEAELSYYDDLNWLMSREPGDKRERRNSRFSVVLG